MRMAESSPIVDSEHTADGEENHRQAAEEEEMSPTLRMIKRKLEERLKDD
jgi:hypothetical protein